MQHTSFVWALPRALLLLAVTLASNLPSQTVHLTGKVDIRVKEGTLQADITMSNLPPVPEYAILLNGGLNLRLVSDSLGKTTYAVNREWKGEISYEAFHYWLPTNDGQGRYIPPALRLSYVGKFPVYTDTKQMSDWEDWKGNIAFNGTSVRASDQSVWYPMFYNLVSGEVQSAVTYDLEISCADCRTIYLGGNVPVHAPSVRLRSDLPVPLMLFAGDFDFSQRGDLVYVNANLTEDRERTITDTTLAIQEYYAGLLGIPYGCPVTYLNATPVAIRPQWGFVTYPAIVRVGFGYGFDGMIDTTTGRVKDHEVAFLAHELAHYYFGTLFRPRGPLFWPLLEGGAEYLSLQYLRDCGTDEEYRSKLAGYLTQVADRSGFPRLATIDNPSEINELYRYSFVPLLLTRLDHLVGRKKVVAFVQAVVESPISEADYRFWLDKLTTAGIDPATFEAAERELLTEFLTVDLLMKPGQ